MVQLSAKTSIIPSELMPYQQIKRQQLKATFYLMRTDTSDIFEGLRKTDIIVIKRTSNLVSRNKRHNPPILMDYLELYQSNNVELKSVPEVLSRRTIKPCARRTCYQYHYICNWLTFFSSLTSSTAVTILMRHVLFK